MIIWVNEQIDPCGLVQACIACQDEQAAKDCHQSWLTSLTDEQKQILIFDNANKFLTTGNCSIHFIYF